MNCSSVKGDFDAQPERNNIAIIEITFNLNTLITLYIFEDIS
jgi:hypothetical protein